MKYLEIASIMKYCLIRAKPVGFAIVSNHLNVKLSSNDKQVRGKAGNQPV